MIEFGDAARRAEGDFLAGEIVNLGNAAILACGPRHFADGVGAIGEDAQMNALVRGDRGRQRHLADRKIAGHQVAHGGAAAIAGDDAVDVEALFLPETLLGRDRVRQAHDQDLVLANGKLLGACDTGECETDSSAETSGAHRAAKHAFLPSSFFFISARPV